MMGILRKKEIPTKKKGVSGKIAWLKLQLEQICKRF